MSLGVIQAIRQRCISWLHCGPVFKRKPPPSEQPAALLICWHLLVCGNHHERFHFAVFGRLQTCPRSNSKPRASGNLLSGRYALYSNTYISSSRFDFTSVEPKGFYNLASVDSVLLRWSITSSRRHSQEDAHFLPLRGNGNFLSLPSSLSFLTTLSIQPPSKYPSIALVIPQQSILCLFYNKPDILASLLILSPYTTLIIVSRCSTTVVMAALFFAPHPSTPQPQLFHPSSSSPGHQPQSPWITRGNAQLRLPTDACVHVGK